MKSELIKTDKFNFVVFNNVYTKEELDQIWLEAKFLCDPNKLKPAGKEVGTGLNKDGNLKKKGNSIFLEDVYFNRSTSNYLTLCKKFIGEVVKKDYISEDFTLNLFFATNTDSTMVSYFTDSDYYEAHQDISCYSYIFWLFQKPKAFVGGDLYFPDIDCNITIDSNCGILFPSWASHEVTKIKMNDEPTKYNGRFSFTTFYSFKHVSS